MGSFNRGRADGGRRFGGGGGHDFNRGPREMFHAVCDNCGKDCEVPFKPSGNKPVYCNDCFPKMGGRSQSSGNRNEGPRHDSGPSLSEVNAKLDRILALLNPQSKEESKPMEEAAPEKKKRAPKKAAPVEEIIVQEEPSQEAPIVEPTPVVEETPVAPEETPTE